MGFVVENERGQVCTHGGSSHLEHEKAEREGKRRGWQLTRW